MLVNVLVLKRCWNIYNITDYLVSECCCETDGAVPGMLLYITAHAFPHSALTGCSKSLVIKSYRLLQAVTCFTAVVQLSELQESCKHCFPRLWLPRSEMTESYPCHQV